MSNPGKTKVKTQKKPSFKGVFSKLVIILLLGLFYYNIINEVFYEAVEYQFASDNLARHKTNCDERYYKKQYGLLYSYMNLYEIYDEPKFEKYWEVIEGKACYEQYRQYVKAGKLGVEGAAEKAEKCKQLVLDNAKNCKNPDNKERLDEFASEVE